ncbi:MAG: hypothetical protein ACYC7E_17115 [Armatimonadota bacterium]
MRTGLRHYSALVWPILIIYVILSFLVLAHHHGIKINERQETFRRLTTAAHSPREACPICAWHLAVTPLIEPVPIAVVIPDAPLTADEGIRRFIPIDASTVRSRAPPPRPAFLF